ncbi:uncharacterized protein LOC115476498 [Microcaecilia unicolor]|uniref:Uncharacterized protein LOC115476498 n=1 Tax=Microcaecilia unicolor TaxID=1415580 RepID=A0A6P7YZ57_9AMPH|nr:uncharacterized protein LOC115476498 [Microcaecilia unicolor]
MLSETAVEEPSIAAVTTENSVVVISDDEADNTLGDSVIILGCLEQSVLEEKTPEEVLDDELAVTFSRKGNVLPHARYDCTTHPFVRTENDTSAPIEKNSDACGQCFCYLCDKLASLCPHWTTPSICHCNAHNKSKYWKAARDTALVGVLTMFNLDLTEIDANLRQGGNRLLKFMQELSAQYNDYLIGEQLSQDVSYICVCDCHRGQIQKSMGCVKCNYYHAETRIYRYSPVYDLVSKFLTQVEQENPETAAVILLGVAKELMLQKERPQTGQAQDPTSTLKSAVVHLMERITVTLQKMLVLHNFPNNLYRKFVDFFKSLVFPPHCYSFTNRLNVLPWSDYLLTSVLMGQNVTGERIKKGKKEFLWESLPVVQARVKRMEDEGKYRQLVRYLKAVRCNNSLPLRVLKDKIPLYMCKYGDFCDAAHMLLTWKSVGCCIACRIIPAEFAAYLKMFRTRSYPSDNELLGQEQWLIHPDSVLKPGTSIKLAIQILYANKQLYRNPKCWISLIQTWCSKTILGEKGHLETLSCVEPAVIFQKDIVHLSLGVLEDLKKQISVKLPIQFSLLNFEAELILAVQAVVRILLDLDGQQPLNSVLEMVFAFGSNLWALKLLLEGISFNENLLYEFSTAFKQELCSQSLFARTIWNKQGPLYVGQLITLFITHNHVMMRSAAFVIMNIILENFSQFSWTPYVANFLKNRVLTVSCSVLTPVEQHELEDKIAVFQKKSISPAIGE